MTLQNLQSAISFARRKYNLKTDKEIAERLNITPSYLSQVLKGSKPITDALRQKIEQEFIVNLDDPLTFPNLEDWIKSSTTFSTESFMNMYNNLRRLLESRSEVIARQQLMIDALMTDRDVLMGAIYVMEPKFLKTLVKEHTFVEPLPDDLWKINTKRKRNK